LGWYGSGGLVVSCPVWFGFGDAAEGDFEAEGSEFADVAVGLAADAGLAFVVAGAEILVPGAGAGEQGVADLQLGVAEGDLGFGFAAAAGEPPVAGAFAGLGAAGGDGGLAGDGTQVPVALLGLGAPGALARLAV
jgi:hypothetical protein